MKWNETISKARLCSKVILPLLKGVVRHKWSMESWHFNSIQLMCAYLQHSWILFNQLHFRAKQSFFSTSPWWKLNVVIIRFPQSQQKLCLCNQQCIYSYLSAMNYLHKSCLSSFGLWSVFWMCWGMNAVHSAKPSVLFTFHLQSILARCYRHVRCLALCFEYLNIILAQTPPFYMNQFDVITEIRFVYLWNIFFFICNIKNRKNSE